MTLGGLTVDLNVCRIMSAHCLQWPQCGTARRRLNLYQDNNWMLQINEQRAELMRIFPFDFIHSLSFHFHKMCCVTLKSHMLWQRITHHWTAGLTWCWVVGLVDLIRICIINGNPLSVQSHGEMLLCMLIMCTSAGEQTQMAGPGKPSGRSRDPLLRAERRWETDGSALTLYRHTLQESYSALTDRNWLHNTEILMTYMNPALPWLLSGLMMF